MFHKVLLAIKIESIPVVLKDAPELNKVGRFGPLQPKFLAMILERNLPFDSQPEINTY